MAKFTDSNGDVWGIELDLGTCRRLAKTVGIDVMNPNDYQELLCSLSARLEYVFEASGQRASQLGVDNLNEFAKCLGEKAVDCSDALQEALISFYLSLGQKELAAQAQVNLKVMTETRKNSEQITKELEQAADEYLQETLPATRG